VKTVEITADHNFGEPQVRRGGTGAWITATGSLSCSITTSAPARTRSRSAAKLLAAFNFGDVNDGLSHGRYD
jgi:hypothetical protein